MKLTRLVASPPAHPHEIIAGAGVQIRRMLPRPDTGGLEFLPGPQGVILNVYTEPSWRRRWLAAALMQRILDWAAANGVKSLVLHPSADGRPPYEKPGFERTNEMRYMGNRR